MNKINQLLKEFIPAIYASHHKRTWEITCALPWGESGHKQWGLSSTEARCLRSILIERAATQRDTLLDYNAEHKCWHVDLHFYPTPEAALVWLSHRPITNDEWDKAMNGQRESTKARVEKLRQKV